MACSTNCSPIMDQMQSTTPTVEEGGAAKVLATGDIKVPLAVFFGVTSVPEGFKPLTAEKGEGEVKPRLCSTNCSPVM